MPEFGTRIPGSFADSPTSPEALATHFKKVQLEEPDVKMTAAPSLEDTALGQLQNGDQASLLDVIDELRGHGISKHIDLPQLIVCGDQSSGKSSLLEAITHLPFPTKDGICTTFATEVALRRSPHREIKITIIPGPSRLDADKERLKRFSATFTNPSDFPALIEDAKKCMKGHSGLFGAQQPITDTSINDDVLHLDISGPNWPPLTIVDLPGLIQSEARGQTAADVATVRRLTQGYAQNPRSVILAVVAANYDHANQAVLRLAREADPAGARTLGIVTKPDRVVVGGADEAAVVRLAKNAEHELRLGWHVVKNRDHAMRDAPSEERDRAERDFFAQGAWSSVLKAHVGVDALRTRLGAILLRQIRAALPDLTGEIKKGIEECQRALARIGEPRETPREQRAYLVDIGKSFERLTLEAVQGTYQNDFFSSPSEEEAQGRRLRAVIQNANEEFASVMLRYGHSRTIVDDDDDGVDDGKQGLGRDHVRRVSSHGSFEGSSGLENTAPAPRITPRAEYVDAIRDMVRSRRGCELPSTYNPLLVCDIFREQAAPWEGIAKEHADIIWQAALAFLETLLGTLVAEGGHTYYALLEEHIQPLMDAKRKQLLAKIDELLLPYKRGHLITYHPLFGTAIQRLKKKRMQDDFLQSLAVRFGRGTTIQTSLEEIAKIVAMADDDDQEQFAAVELLYCMEAFYKVALHTFVDNAATLAVESCLVSSLSDVFSPGVVANLDDDALAALASESEETKHERFVLRERLRSLTEGARIVGRHARQVPTIVTTPQKPTAAAARAERRASAKPQRHAHPERTSTPPPRTAHGPTATSSASSSSSSTPLMSRSVASDAASALPTPANSPDSRRRDSTPQHQFSKRSKKLQDYFAREKPDVSYLLDKKGGAADEESPMTALSNGLAGLGVADEEL